MDCDTQACSEHPLSRGGGWPLGGEAIVSLDQQRQATPSTDWGCSFPMFDS
jgi:hypothetical protein